MTRFIRADSLAPEEIEAGIADGTLRPCALGPCDGKWYVRLQPGDDPSEVHAGLPGGNLHGYEAVAGAVTWEFPEVHAEAEAPTDDE